MPRFAASVCLVLAAGCGASPTYSRYGREKGGEGGSPSDPEPLGQAGASGSGGGEIGTAGISGLAGSGGSVTEGSGGTGTGGVSLIGGAPGTASGGVSVVAGGTSGKGSGGQGIGAAGSLGQASGGQGSGGQAAGGQGMAGRGMGGAGTGGQGAGTPGTGGSGTGGQAIGGHQGAGGQGTGGAEPMRLILSIDLVGGRGKAGTEMADAEMAGARRASHWNSAAGTTGTLANLTLSDGTASAARITWNASTATQDPGIWTLAYTDAPGDVRMMNGYLDPTWSAVPAVAPTVLTISGLPAAIASGKYDVYLYTLGSLDGDTRSYQYGVGSTMQTVAQDTEPGAPPS